MNELTMTRRPPRAVYSVTSSGHDLFSVMSRVSIASLRLSNPDIEVTLACDTVSAQELKSSHDPLLSEVDELLTCDTPPGDPVYRNRHVKTRLREIVEGPFLLLDSDTLVRGDVSCVLSVDSDIAGAPNHSSDEYDKQIWDRDLETLNSMGWRVGGQAYINGGVLFFNETPGAHRFARLWHQKWLDSFAKCAWHRDQAALNSALFDANPRLEILPHDFNAQFKMAPQGAEHAIIWHFYSSCSGLLLTSFETLVEGVLRGNRLCLETVAEMIQRPHPWNRESLVDDWIAKRLAHTGCLDSGYKAWFQGRRTNACRYWIASALKNYSAKSRRFFTRTATGDV